MDREEKAKLLKFGLLPRLEGVPTLSFKTFAREGAVLGAFPTTLPQFDATVDYLEDFKTWEVLGNNSFGDCNAVAWANQRRLVTATLGKKELYPNLQQVIEFYKTQNPDFDPNGSKDTNGPDSSADGGMNIQTGLNELRKNGSPDGVRPVAFAEVDTANLEEVHQAISIFGSLWIGFTVYDTIFAEFKAHKPFTVGKKGHVVGGHAVLVGGYVPNMKCVTWGDVNQFDDKYWTSRNVSEAWAVIWPEHLGTHNFMTGVNLQQLALAMKDLTGEDLTIPDAPFSNLYFIKTRNEESGQTEVHIADHSSSYATPTGQYPSCFGPDEGDNGVFCIDDGDLYFAKTQNTDSGSVEVHRATADSQYSTFDIQTPTAFQLSDANNGTWTVDGGDLYLIKTKNTTSGQVEVSRVKHLDWAKIDFQEKTALPLSEGPNGTWDIWGGNLYFIKYRQTQGQNVEIHYLGGNDDYKKTTVYKTWFNVSDGDNGTWEIGAHGDLYFTKTRNTGSGQAEVHIATAESQYQTVSHYATYISEADDANGTWCIR